MFRFLKLVAAGLTSAVVLSQSANAQIAADPTSPALTPAFCPGGLPPLSNGIWNGELPAWVPAAGRPLVKVELTGVPAAVCNDGSPAAMFVRPAPANLPNGQINPLRRMYHIHLKGGGSCRSFEECRRRWCNAAGTFPNQPGLMSSRGWTDLVAGRGLFADRALNRFSHANQVLVGYCSSDTWIGSSPAGTAVSENPADVPGDVSRIAFMGETIVNAALDTLDSGLTVPVPQLDREIKMPKLPRANHIWITGDSAGGNGVRHHLDRIAARYPDALTLGGIDAGGAIDMTDPRIDWSLLPSGPTDFETFMKARVLQARSFHGVDDSALDSSCKTANPGGGFDEQACFNGFELGRDHITTPVIQRTSLADSTTSGSLGPMLAAPSGLTLRQLAFDGLRASAATNPTLSALGANCTRHVTFRNSGQVARMRSLRKGLNLYRELDLWVFGCMAAGTCPKMVTLAMPNVANASNCP
ncbi:MAG: pectin acetylesterase-family hydrolase [Sulfitobacter sp.]